MHRLEQLDSGELKGARSINLSCGLTEFPKKLFTLCESLEVMDLSMNRLSALPDDFGRFSKLKIAFFSDNLFTELPRVLADCRELSMIGFKSNQIAHVPENSLPGTTRWLILTNNRITRLPASIGKCTRLQKVALAGNFLTGLPAEMAECRNLELLRISANKLTALPEWLFKLPKLSWLAFAGNPFSFVPRVTESLEEIDWNAFEILEQLGEGASGNIYKARWIGKDKIVAIKVFKGEVTSDGFPEDEMQASIAAGVHPSLVKLLGKIKNHSLKRNGLIMDLIPASFYNLGLPPSLETCSRDTFKEGTQFTGVQILKIVSAIASVTHHLHERGISHGDLYAHNILTDAGAESLMGDFGAASFYEVGSMHAREIQRIEVRAFGCLLEDLLLNLAVEERESVLVKKLGGYAIALMQEDLTKRPLFGEVINYLKSLGQDLS